jgi:hypothetical protein
MQENDLTHITKPSPPDEMTLYPSSLIHSNQKNEQRECIFVSNAPHIRKCVALFEVSKFAHAYPSGKSSIRMQINMKYFCNDTDTEEAK